jgi:hypothetical protein
VPLDPLEITGGLAIGEGLGGAIEATVEPRLQNFKNDQWSKHQTKPLDPADAAAAEQQGFPGNLTGITDASYSGIDGDRYLALRFLAATAPGTPELLELWRRDKIGPDLVRTGLKKAGLLDAFVDAVMELFTGRLDPAVIATAIQRGIMPDPGFLPVGPPTATGKVPAFPVSPLDPIAEAKAHGIDEERLFVETAIVGLPLSLQQAASAYFRGIIELADFERAVAEGNTRNEWGDAALEQARQILSANEWVQLRLRAWINDDQFHAGAALHGMTPANADLLLKAHGRPISFHQTFIGLRRGGALDGPTNEIDPAFLRSLQESDIRPEWYNLAWAQRYTYPTAFVLRTLTEAGDLTQADTERILLFEGWEPTLAAKVSAKWATPAAGKTDPWVAKADTQLWTATHKAYKGGGIDAAAATARFDLIGIDAAAQADVLARWDSEKAL